MLDVTECGSLISKSVEDAITIIEIIALSDHQGKYNRNPTQRNNRIIKLNLINVILAQNKMLTQVVDELTKQLSKL